MLERVLRNRQSEDTYEDSYGGETLLLSPVQPVIHNEGASPGSWTHAYRRKALHMHQPGLQQKILKSRQTKDPLKTSCMSYSSRLLKLLHIDWRKALHLSSRGLRKGLQRKRQSFDPHENSQWTEALQVWLRRLWHELHHSGPLNRPQASSLWREALQLYQLRRQVHALLHPQNSPKEAYRREALQMRKMWKGIFGKWELEDSPEDPWRRREVGV